MSKILAVTSGKGGVGKSTFSVSLGTAFGKLGKRVLLIDMDEGLRCLDLMLGVDKETVFDLADILKGKDIEDALYKSKISEGLYLIPAPARVGEIDIALFKSFALKLKEKFDIIIFDFPAGINIHLYKALPEATEFITVAIPDPISIRDASAVGMALRKENLSSKLIINRFIYKECLKHRYKNIDEMIDGCCLRLLGIVPQSEELAMLSIKRKLKKNGKALLAFTRIARRLIGEEIPLPKIKKI